MRQSGTFPHLLLLSIQPVSFREVPHGGIRVPLDPLHEAAIGPQQLGAVGVQLQDLLVGPLSLHTQKQCTAETTMSLSFLRNPGSTR